MIFIRLFIIASKVNCSQSKVVLLQKILIPYSHTGFLSFSAVLYMNYMNYNQKFLPDKHDTNEN